MQARFDWFRDYVWNTYGEMIRAALLVAFGVLATGIGVLTGFGELTWTWAAGIGFAALQATTAYIRGWMANPKKKPPVGVTGGFDGVAGESTTDPP